MGWAGCANGDLIRLAGEHGFEVLVTRDQQMEGEAHLDDVSIPIIVMGTQNGRVGEMARLMPEVISLLGSDLAAGFHYVVR